MNRNSRSPSSLSFAPFLIFLSYTVFFILLYLFILFSTSTFALAGTTFYVSKAGNNSNTCGAAQSLSTPKLTIAAGISCLSVGQQDTLYVRSGTYAEQISTFPNGSSWENAATIAVYPGDTVIWEPSGSGINNRALNIVSSILKQYVIFDGFIFDGKGTSGFLINLDGTVIGGNSVNHIRFYGVEIKNARTQGILAGRGANFIEIINSKVHNNGTDTQYDHGIYLQSSNCKVENSEFYSNAGAGIQIYTGLPGDRANNNLIRRNRVHHNRFGIILGSGDNNQAIENVVYEQQVDTIGYGIGTGFNSFGTKIINNTVYHSKGNGIEVRGGSTSVLVQNNISYLNGNQAIYNGGAGTTQTTNLTTTPGFTNAASGDFSLLGGSAAIDSGTNIGGVPFNGLNRDRGAFETIGACTGILPDAAGNNVIQVTCEDNVSSPFLPSSSCPGFAVKKGASTQTISSCSRLSAGVYSILLSSTFSESDTGYFLYSPGTITTSPLTGAVPSSVQKMFAFSDILLDNQITSGGTTVKEIAQDNYRFEGYGGSEVSPNEIDVINVPISTIPNSCRRVRMGVRNLGSEAESFGIVIHAQMNGTGAYTRIPDGPCSSVGICMAKGTGVLPPDIILPANTTEQLFLPGTFIPGPVITTNSEIPTLPMGVGKDTEVLGFVCIGAGTSAGNSFKLKLYRADGTAFETYTDPTKIPLINISTGGNASVGAP